MPRLIDADAVLERVKPYSESDVEWACTGETVKHLIYAAIGKAPIVDAVEVVRCKDCIWYYRKACCPLACSGFEIEDGDLPRENDFCSYGERRDKC